VALRSFGLTPDVVSSALARENQEVRPGAFARETASAASASPDASPDPRAFGRYRRLGPQWLADPHSRRRRVIDTIAERRSASLLGDMPTLTIDVLKISGSNTVAVADGVKAIIAEVERTLPEDVTLRLTRDDSRRIREALHDVQLTIVLGAVLTVMIIYLFLNSWRSTVITGLRCRCPSSRPSSPCGR